MRTPPSDLFLQQLLDALPDGVIYHQIASAEAETPPTFEWVYHNESARPFTETPFFNPTALQSALTDAYQSGEARQRVGGYELEHRKWADGVLTTVRMGRAAEENQSFQGILDASLNGIVSYRAVRDAAGRIIDFEAQAINRAAARVLRLPDQEPGWRMLERFPAVAERGTFDRYVGVVETGTWLRFETGYDADGVSGWFDVSAVKLGDGFVITFYDISDTREAVWEIERQRALVNGILQNSLAGMAVYEAVRDGTGRIVDFRFGLMNPAGLALFPYDRATLDTHTLLELFPQSPELGLFPKYIEVIETGQPYQVELYYPMTKGWYAVSLSKVEDSVLSTFIDISASREATRQIEEQRSLLTSVIENSPYGLVVYEPIPDETGQAVDFRATLYNRQAYEFGGLAEADLRDKTMRERNPDLPKDLTILQQVIATGEPHTLDYPVPGTRTWLHTRIARFGNGLIITTHDITESKTAAEQIEAQNALLAGVLNTSLNGKVVYEAIRDAEGTITDFRFRLFNETARQDILQRTGRDIAGNTLLGVYPDSFGSGLFNLYARVTETGNSLRLEHYYADFDVWYDVSLTPLGDGCVVTFVDITERKRAGQALERQADLLNTVLNSSTNGITALQPIRDDAGTIVDFRYLMINEVGARLGGKTVEEITGGRVSDLYPGMERTGIFDFYRKAIETGESLKTDLHYNTEGLDVWLTVDIRKNGDGVVVTYIDVTESRRARQQIEDQANLLNSVLDSSTNGIMAFQAERDAAGTITDFTFLSVNEASCQLTGKTAGELLRRRLLDVFPGNVESGLFAQYVRTVETGEPARTELHYAHDGLNFWIDVSARKLGDGFVVTFTDVSAVRRAAQELQMVIDTSQTGIFLFTPERNAAGEVVDFRFRVVNRMLAAYVGQHPGAVNGELGSRWFPGYQTNGLFEQYRDTYLTGQTHRFDFHYYQDGIDAWLDIMSTKLGDEVLVTFSDYTPLKRLQLELEGTVQQLQTSNENLERFAYVASHDLQEPLRKIQSFGDMIFKRHAPTLPPDAADKLGRMQSAAMRMQALINDLLTYSRLSSAEQRTEFIDLNRLLHDVRTDLEVTIREKRAALSADSLPVVEGDPLQLRQLFQNLLSNALKFNQPGTPPRVEVRYRTVQGTEVPEAVELQPQGRYHEISVRDHGIGFDQQYADQVFEAFRRLHNRAEYPGTGIGLAIVKRVLENHRGDVVVRSEPNQGTTFRIFLPV